MTSTQNFIPATDVYCQLLDALDILTGLGYFATHATALVEDPDNYECRCCTVIPEHQRDRYVVATGGAGTTCTADWICERGGLAISWRGDGAEIVAVLRDAGLDASWDGDPDKCVLVEITDWQRTLVAHVHADEIGRYNDEPEGED